MGSGSSRHRRRQPRHLLDRAVEGAFGGKRADVELIDHLAWIEAPPVLVVPDEGVRIDFPDGPCGPSGCEREYGSG